jgi:murein DD-endopeptidase MepM/ murein hydrolase activator NlpD
MSDRLHIIIAEEEGKTRNLLLSKRKLQISFFITVSLFICLSIISYNVLNFFQSNKSLNSQVAELSEQLQKTILDKETLASQVADFQQNENQSQELQQEKATLLNTAISELEERSSMIERIMCNIGVEVKDLPKNNKNSGGPFIAPTDTIGRDILFRSDHYMKTMHFLPLGHPVPGHVTSRFGHRTDPVNGKKGFHTGVDLKGRSGQKIVATADGTVTKSFVNGSYGNYIEISHSNGYSTKFAHLKKRLVKRGEQVTRGQTIGTVGNSGRSTGSHLHYEVCFNKKPINPSKFMRVDKLVKTPFIPKLKVLKNRKIKHQVVAKNKASGSAVPEN